MLPQDSNETQEQKPVFLPLSGWIYDKLKFIALVFLPAFSTLYFTLGAVWDLPAVEQVIGTCAALSTFLGVLLGLSTKAYNNSDGKFDGDIVITTNGAGQKIYSLELNGHPSLLNDKESVSFRIKPAA